LPRWSCSFTRPRPLDVRRADRATVGGRARRHRSTVWPRPRGPRTFAQKGALTSGAIAAGADGRSSSEPASLVRARRVLPPESGTGRRLSKRSWTARRSASCSSSPIASAMCLRATFVTKAWSSETSGASSRCWSSPGTRSRRRRLSGATSATRRRAHSSTTHEFSRHSSATLMTSNRSWRSPARPSSSGPDRSVPSVGGCQFSPRNWWRGSTVSIANPATSPASTWPHWSAVVAGRAAAADRDTPDEARLLGPRSLPRADHQRERARRRLAWLAMCACA